MLNVVICCYMLLYVVICCYMLLYVVICCYTCWVSEYGTLYVSTCLHVLVFGNRCQNASHLLLISIHNVVNVSCFTSSSTQCTLTHVARTRTHTQTQTHMHTHMHTHTHTHTHTHMHMHKCTHTSVFIQVCFAKTSYSCRVSMLASLLLAKEKRALKRASHCCIHCIHC